ncbi:MAG: coenzyme F420-reducing hydrogenase, FrhD protein [Methanoregulaceae archaeon]|nr:coenzyme F420-reducing hydrogenase, FrhD protein [Methanoregulaceae archaeon]
MLFPEIVVAGCGNPLFADDGFGPAVAEELARLELPDTIKVVIDPDHTKRLIIIDTADFGAKPGEIRDFSVEDLPAGSYRDIHSWDLTEPLQRLKDAVDITVIGCQPGRVTAPEFELGLTDEVKDAIPRTVRHVLELLGVDYGMAIKNLRNEGRQRETGRETCFGEG